MAILQCTKKLLSGLKTKPEDILRDFTELGCWHANLLRIDRRKCVLFTHDKTLYSFLVPGLTKPHFQNFNDVFGQNLFKNLLTEKFPQDQIELFLNDIREIHITKTNNRSVLGSMNDLSFQLKYRISAEGGLSNLSLMKLNHGLNRIPMGAIEEVYSIDALKNLLENHPQE